MSGTPPSVRTSSLPPPTGASSSVSRCTRADHPLLADDPPARHARHGPHTQAGHGCRSQAGASRCSACSRSSSRRRNPSAGSPSPRGRTVSDSRFRTSTGSSPSASRRACERTQALLAAALARPHRQAGDDGRARGRGRHPGSRRPERTPSSGHDEDASRSRAGRRRRERPGPRDVEPVRLRNVGVSRRRLHQPHPHPAVPGDDVAREIEVAAQRLPDILGVPTFGEGREADQVDEEDRHETTSATGASRVDDGSPPGAAAAALVPASPPPATSTRPVPHSPQNLVPGVFGDAQFGHVTVSRVAHSPQKFRPGSFGVPQVGHVNTGASSPRP